MNCYVANATRRLHPAFRSSSTSSGPAVEVSSFMTRARVVKNTQTAAQFRDPAGADHLKALDDSDHPATEMQLVHRHPQCLTGRVRQPLSSDRCEFQSIPRNSNR